MAVEAVIFQQIVDMNWDQAIYTASPNNTINVAQFAAKGSGTNIGIALTPKGAGYISAQVPDGTTAGGNARAARSVDFQTVRSNANQVTSGDTSFIASAQNCIASGTRSVVIGGSGCSVTGTQSVVVGGSSSSCAGQGSVVFGNNNAISASAPFSLCGGTFATADGYCSLVFGIGAKSNSTTRDATAIGRGALAHLSGQFSIGCEGFGDGTNHFFHVGYFGKTTTNAEVELLLTDAKRFVLRAGTVVQGTLAITGVKSDGSAVARYMRRVAIKRVGATTSLVGALDTIGTDEAAGTSISITADDTNESLKVAATGVSGETWRWQAWFSGPEIVYGA